MLEVQDRCMSEYKKIMDEFPLLSSKKERELIKIINKYKGGKAKHQARETLLKSNIRLVLKEASRFQKVIPLNDLMSAGCEGLWIATERYDPKFKTKFSTYAVPWIKLRLYQTLDALGTMVHIPTNIRNKSNKYKTLMEINKNKSFTDKELRKTLQISQKCLSKIRIAQTFALSIDYSHVNNEGDDGYTLLDFIPDEKIENPRIETENKEMNNIVHKALDELNPIQKDILTSRYLNGSKVKLSSLGKKWNISGERIRQIEVQALKNMKKKIKNKTDFKLG